MPVFHSIFCIIKKIKNIFSFLFFFLSFLGFESETNKSGSSKKFTNLFLQYVCNVTFYNINLHKGYRYRYGKLALSLLYREADAESP